MTLPTRLLKVLLIEDDQGDADLIRISLAESAEPVFRVVHRMTLADGIRQLTQDNADVVLLDLSLPDAAGEETVKTMREAAPEVPIVILTGFDDLRFAERMLNLGAQDYLVKGDASGPMVSRAIRYAITRMTAQREYQDLLHRLMAEQEKLARELAVARSHQMALLPSPVVTRAIEGSHGLKIEGLVDASSSIGGDVWGCYPINARLIGIFVFDFSGHGITAALNSFRLHTLIEEHSEVQDDPAWLLKVLNGLLRLHLPRGQYATMFYGVIDIAANLLRWSGAGAPPPILLAGETPSFLDTTGRPLGLGDGSGYVNREVPFPPGSTLFLYSDGITEAEHLSGGYFGEDNLLRVVRERTSAGAGLEDLVGALWAELQKPLVDDLTAVLIRRPRKAEV